MEEKTPGRKRPDVVERIKARKGKQETVIKCCLSNRLIEKSLTNEIQKWVLTTSKVTNKGSLVFNRLLLHCLNNNIELPNLSDQTLYLQCFNIGVGRINKKIKVLTDVWESYFSGFPEIQKNRGDIQTYVYASKKYMTNFKNSLIYTFKNRQKGYIRKWCSVNDITEKGACHSIQCAINGWECRSEVPEKAKKFVKKQRKKLEDPDGITFTWIGTRMELVVKYFYYILRFMRKYDDVRKFTLAPISSIKRHFLTIDTTVLYEMMKNTNLICDIKIKTFLESRREYWESIFNINGLCKKGEFSDMIETDGVSVCFHFKIPKVDKMGNRKIKKAERVIAIDPGRSNLIFGVEKLSTDKIKTYKLTRRQYYTESGMKTATRKAAHWEKEIEPEELVYRKISPKTTKGKIWNKFLQNYYKVYDKLWEVKTKKKWSRERFRVYCLKRKTLDKFFSKMDGKIKPVIAYGAAKFNPTNKNELSAPTTFLAKRCSKFYPTVMVDEYNTTKVCVDCDCKLSKVIKKKPEGIREVRGLRWCSSTKCRTFKDRDLNASLNILRCFCMKTQRPQSLYRNSGSPKAVVKSFMIYDANSTIADKTI
uniref:Putative transposase DNA-binding domain protein n=1 Tax=Marseillevirus LCMAC101 TaxID=2506602 RepID=A0A481YSH6_9VIRU|nr:MAG: putative transposase DNA-binding domain protein [Marseillevirus LCMAC101]